MSDPVQRAREQLAATGPVLGVAWAPYRLSPFGAHTDHQEGPTAGLCLDRGLALAFRATEGAALRITSERFDGEASATLSDPGPARGGWEDYVTGVVATLASRFGFERGFEGRVCAEACGGGLSSSAALQVAAALALFHVNGARVDREAVVDAVVRTEHERVGVSVGRLDPTVILYGRERSLVLLDPRKGKVGVHRLPAGFPAFDCLLVDVGDDRSLRESPYDQRVAECREAARLLGSASEPPVLRDVTPEAFRRRRGELPETERRRAEHWFSEVKRVRRALQVLAVSDLEGLANLMNASTDSLETFFDCGSPETSRAVRLLRCVPGCLGAGFAGGGFGGTVQALVAAGKGEAVMARLAADWSAEGEGVALRGAVATMGGGARVDGV